MLKFDEPIFHGRFLRRYQRFFMDVLLDDGTTITAHTPNTGSMQGLLIDNSRVLLTKSANRKRAYPFTAQAIEIDCDLVGINTHAPNKLIKASLDHPLLQEELQDYRSIKSEYRYGKENRSRVDFYFADANNKAPLYLEIKNVTMKIGDSAQFPDSVSERALKHVDDLVAEIQKGSRAALWFIVQRQDCKSFSAASHVDPRYAQALAKAELAGVQMRALAARISASGLALTHEIPCFINQ